MLGVRRANAADIPEISAVLIASITELCAADHGNDPAAIAAWTRNKSVDGVAAMLANPDLEMHVVEADGVLVAVGSVFGNGTIGLNYVAPWARGIGASTVLLKALESAIDAMGHAEGRLESTRTAYAFYCARGWVPDGPQAAGRMVNGYPMRKSLL